MRRGLRSILHRSTRCGGEEWKKFLQKHSFPCRMLHGCKRAEKKGGIRSTWDICWRRCNSCKELTPVANGEQMIDTDTIWSMLEEVNDPEVPVLSVVDLGIVREVRANGEE